MTENGFRKSKNGFISFFTGSSVHKRLYTDEDILIMKNMKLSGMTYRAIEKELGISGVNKLIDRYNPIVDDTVIPDGYITIKDYCELNSITYSSAYRMIKQNKIETIKKNNKLYLDRNTVFRYRLTLSEEEIDKIIEMSRQGYTISSIRKVTGHNNKTISYYTNRETIKYRDAEKYRKVNELRDKGYSIREIAKELDIPYGSIHYMLTKKDV